MPESRHDIPFLIGSDFVERHNVAWRVELGQADPANPLIEPEAPWADGVSFMHGTVLRDPIDGKWKAWGTAAPSDTFDRRIVYYESEDGMTWQRPELDLHPFEDYGRTNIVLDLDSGGTSIYSNVLIDPDAPSNRRYQMYVLRRPEEPEGRPPTEAVRGFTRPDGTAANERGVYRYVSCDGVNWNPDVGPVLVNDPYPLARNGTADGFFVYREGDGYVIYHKTIIEAVPGGLIPYELSPGGCRVLVQRRSVDGIDWDPHEPCLMPDWRDTPDTQFMEMSVTPVSGGYVGILTLYRTGNQTLELQFTASRDGRHWWRPDRRACVPMPSLGDYGGGMMWGTHHMIEDRDKIHYYYGGIEGLHGDMLATSEMGEIARSLGRTVKSLKPLLGESLTRLSNEPRHHGALCRATWRRGRLWGLTTTSGGNTEGYATTDATMERGQTLDVNVKTTKGGQILAEFVTSDGSVVPGFSREDCTGVRGDSLRSHVTWGDKSEAPSDGLRARFILGRARLYGFEFVDTR